MALQDLFVPYSTFYGRVLLKEAGMLRILAYDYLQGLKDTCPDDQTIAMPYKNLYLPQYPFRTSFTESILIDTEVANKERYKEWAVNHIDLDGDTELPVYLENHTFNNFFRRRLEPSLKNWIYPNQFNECKDKPIILFGDHRQCLVLNSVEDYHKLVLFVDKDTGDVTISVPALDHIPTYRYESRFVRTGKYLEHDLDSPYVYHIGNMGVYQGSDVTKDTLIDMIHTQISRGYTTIDVMPWF